MKSLSPVRNNATALLAMLAGTALILGGVVLINKIAEPPEKELREKQVKFQVKPEEQKPPQSVVKKPPPPKKTQQTQAPPNPLKGLQSAVGSIDVGIPSVDTGDLTKADDSLLGESKDVVMTSDSVDQPPRVTSAGQLQYPASARSKGVEGYVLLSILVDRDGEVEKVKVLESDPSGIFDQAAVQGVRNWEFKPGTYKGQKVKSWVRQRISFNLS